jgi:hypothetical protein
MDSDATTPTRDDPDDETGFDSSAAPGPAEATPVSQTTEERLLARVREAGARNRAAAMADAVDTLASTRSASAVLANSMGISKTLDAMLGLRRQWDTFDRLSKLTAGPGPSMVLGVGTPSATTMLLGGTNSPISRALSDAATFASRRPAGLGVYEVMKGESVLGVNSDAIFKASAGARRTPELAQFAPNVNAAQSALLSVHRSPNHLSAISEVTRLLTGGGGAGIYGRKADMGLGVWVQAARSLDVMPGFSLLDDRVWARARLLGGQPWLSKLNLTGAVGALYEMAGAWERLDQFLRVPSGGLDALQRLLDETAAVYGEFDRTWEGTPLSYLMFNLGLRTVRTLMNVPAQLREAVVIEALGEALAAGTYIHWLRQAIWSAPHLVAEQREVLDEALSFAERSQWNLAVRLLLNGFEGAVFNALVSTDGYADPSNGHVHAMEKLMDSEVFEPDFRQFVKRRLYTDRGNPFRHGRTPPGARELTLMGVVALAGWLEQFAQTDALERLVGYIDEHVDEVVARVRNPDTQPQ